MLRLIFPEISFSGRLSRAAFWRELMLATITTPLVIGGLAFLVNEFSVAAAHGLKVDDAAAKYFAGAVLSLIGFRNVLAFAGVIKRRLNDVGHGSVDFRRSVQWMLVAAGGSILLFSQMGLRSGAILVVFLYLFFLWQLKNLLVGGFKLLFAASKSDPFAEPHIDAAASPRERLGRHLAQWRAQNPSLAAAVEKAGNEFQGLAKNMSNAKSPQELWAEIVAAAQKVPALSKFENLRRWLNEPVVGNSSETAGRVRTAEIKSRSRTGEERDLGRHGDKRASRRVAKKPGYATPRGKAVQASRRPPKHGRSSFLSGLLRGPWG